MAIEIPAHYLNVVRLRIYAETYPGDSILGHNYEVLTGYANTKNGELRIDSDGYLYVLKPMCWIFQSVMHFFIKWYQEGWRTEGTHSYRLEQAAKLALAKRWIVTVSEKLYSFDIKVSDAQRTLNAGLANGRFQLAMQEVEERKAACVNQLCQSMLATMDLAFRVQDIAPSYVAIFAAGGNYVELRTELAQGRIPIREPIVRGFLPPHWTQIIEQLVL